MGILLVAATAQTQADQDPLVGEFLHASAEGQCIESVTYRLISEQGTQQAVAIVRSALVALAQHEQHQRGLGCTGDIAAQAIAAGADPAEVLHATAAGL